MNTDKFHQVILPLKDKLFRLALSIIRERQESEDIVQDVLLKIWTKKDEWEGIENLEAYCFRMTKNLALDRLDSSNLRKTEWLENENDSIFLMDKDTPHRQFIRKETLSHIEQCVEELPDNQKMVFRLREIEGMNYKDIAEIVDISEDLVKVSLFRARKKIREQLSNLEKDGI